MEKNGKSGDACADLDHPARLALDVHPKPKNVGLAIITPEHEKKARFIVIPPKILRLAVIAWPSSPGRHRLA